MALIQCGTSARRRGDSSAGGYTRGLRFRGGSTDLAVACIISACLLMPAAGLSMLLTAMARLHHREPAISATISAGLIGDAIYVKRILKCSIVSKGLDS